MGNIVYNSLMNCWIVFINGKMVSGFATFSDAKEFANV